LLFLPLGGTGEIGINMTLCGHDGHWLIVDLGITFGNDDFPRQDVLMPDPAFIEAQRDRLAGIVLTHGHEDHIGALPYLWPRLRCPVYATPFTAAMVRGKLARAGIDGVPLVEITGQRRFAIGPFMVHWIGMTHSIPGPNMLLIETGVGRDGRLEPVAAAELAAMRAAVS
jgi:ribonuclease J